GGGARGGRGRARGARAAAGAGGLAARRPARAAGAPARRRSLPRPAQGSRPGDRAVRGVPGALPALLERRRGAAPARNPAPRGPPVRPTLRPGARLAATLLAAAWLACAASAGAKLLVPMDDAQTDHLKAYGLTYWVLAHGQT